MSTKEQMTKLQAEIDAYHCIYGNVRDKIEEFITFPLDEQIDKNYGRRCMSEFWFISHNSISRQIHHNLEGVLDQSIRLI